MTLLLMLVALGNNSGSHADDLLDIIKPGNRIFLSSGAAIPARSVNEIITSDSPNVQDLELIQLITLGDYLSVERDREVKFRLKTFNIGESIPVWNPLFRGFSSIVLHF